VFDVGEGYLTENGKRKYRYTEYYSDGTTVEAGDHSNQYLSAATENFDSDTSDTDSYSDKIFDVLVVKPKPVRMVPVIMPAQP
jgi:hypothetical protein